jgi:hypothetical protein
MHSRELAVLVEQWNSIPWNALQVGHNCTRNPTLAIIRAIKLVCLSGIGGLVSTCPASDAIGYEVKVVPSEAQQWS